MSFENTYSILVKIGHNMKHEYVNSRECRDDLCFDSDFFFTNDRSCPPASRFAVKTMEKIRWPNARKRVLISGAELLMLCGNAPEA